MSQNHPLTAISPPADRGVEAAITLLDAEAHRQMVLKDELFGAGDAQGAKAAHDLAWHYQVAAEFLRNKLPRRL